MLELTDRNAFLCCLREIEENGLIENGTIEDVIVESHSICAMQYIHVERNQVLMQAVYSRPVKVEGVKAISTYFVDTEFKDDQIYLKVESDKKKASTPRFGRWDADDKSIIPLNVESDGANAKGLPDCLTSRPVSLIKFRCKVCNDVYIELPYNADGILQCQTCHDWLKETD